MPKSTSQVYTLITTTHYNYSKVRMSAEWTTGFYPATQVRLRPIEDRFSSKWRLCSRCGPTFRYWKWRLGISSRRKHNPIHHRHNRKFLSWRSCRCFTLSRSLRCFTYFPLKVEFLTGHKASCTTKQTGQLWLRCLRILFENSTRPTWIIPRNTSGVSLFSRWA